MVLSGKRERLKGIRCAQKHGSPSSGMSSKWKHETIEVYRES